MAKKPVKPVKLPETEEEWIAQCLASFAQTHETMIPHLPESTYPFWPGTQVEIGHLGDCVVVDTAYEGRVLVIKCRDVGTSYGKPYDKGYRYGAWPWTSAVPKSEVKDTKLSVASWMFPFTTRHLGHLLHQVTRYGVIENPDYQRDYVWTDADKESLISNVLAGYPIGTFIFKRHPYPESRSDVIDGKQRLKALVDFMLGRWAYKGLHYWNLSTCDRSRIEERPIQWCELPESATRLDCLKMFLACNAGGVPQTNGHIAKVQKLYEEELKTQGETS